jgi:aspartyl-tRNA(Asn)/glutamyl-tRNA(Gln) amidotransferase subunit A
MTALIDLTLMQMATSLRKREVSSQELTQACLKRIDYLERELHAFITLAPEAALRQAAQADKCLANWRNHPDESLPPLLGIPTAIKDVLCVADMRCTCGSRILENFIPVYNATVVERLLASGMVILGKTNMDEFAMGSSTENSAYGVTRNPWDLDRVPGGSSGGSAAAVASCMIPIALGTDTGGSVRQPASFCGLTGIKPTYGRISRYGLIAYGSSLDVVGVIGRSAADIVEIFVLMAGVDPLDATSMNLPVPKIDLEKAPEEIIQNLRIGVPEEYFISGIQAEVEAAIWKAVRLLETYGAQVKSVSLPHTGYALPVYYLIAPAEASANLARYDGVRYGPRLASETLWDVFRETRGEKFGAEVKRRIMLGAYALSAGYYDAYYGQAQKIRTLIKDDFEKAFQVVDVIAAPVSPTVAFRIGEHSNDPLAMYLEDIFTLPANLAGVPGLAFPVGFDNQGLPIGMQLLAPHFGEVLLFQVAHAYQQYTDWHSQKPSC